LWFALAVVVGHNPDAPPYVVSDLSRNIERPDGIVATLQVTARPLDVLKPTARHILNDDPTRSASLNDAQRFGPEVGGVVTSSSCGAEWLAWIAGGE